jgi:hypothetical protein
MVSKERNIIAQVASFPIPQYDIIPFFPKWEEKVGEYDYENDKCSYRKECVTLNTIVRVTNGEQEQYQVYISDYFHCNINDPEKENKRKEHFNNFIQNCYTISMTSYDEIKLSNVIRVVLDNCQTSERLLYTDKYSREKLMKEMEYWEFYNEK